MSWAGIANNQTVSFNNLQDAVNNSVFTLKTAIPASNEQITKADANTYVYIDTSYGPYASKSSNQLVVKSNLQSVTIFYLSYSTDGFAYACAIYPPTTVYYASVGSTLQNGTIIYTDPGLTTPAPAGYYSDGTNSWQITSSGLAGAFYNQTSCALTTVTIYWDVREQGSGHVSLVIKDASNTTLLSQVSSSSGPINGTLTITQSQTPYSVIVSVDSGSEVAQYRICNNTNETQITLNTSVTTTDTYVVSPTPITSSVNATYGDSNTPATCTVS